VKKTKLAIPGIDLNRQDRHGKTALNWAALRGRLGVVEALLADPQF
jgi:ankyrin repeat protein